ncbi:acetyl-CoA acetyltransferase 2 isoform X1 [Alnus glutinosa]|uniref:acetyl-CoA acetyltransferase 2 isoform X1 n=2 Tax=Alnus glutinosa TaxID=3517 RepID=UPI002D77847C|nr:acetyl-CoA acetyltransferase 2 isoform X1 [Alnus glutinosa]
MAPVSVASSDSIKPRDVCIVGVARTPIGGLLGTLSSLSATKLGSIAIECALKRANVDPSLVQEVFFGNVLSANLGQAPARQAALGAGIPTSVICTTINKVCSSGMKATMLAAQSIQLGLNDVVVAGGMESMSNAPKYLAEARKGSRFGHDTIVDGMLKDGLWDVYNDFGMGACGEICANQHTITREEQDNYAIRSFERGISAQNGGHFAWEIVPVEISGGRGKPPIIVDKDEGLGKFDAAKLRKLRPSFKEDGGSITAGNASSISDGAAALVLVSGEKALQLGLQVIAKIKGFADAAQAPELFPTAPALAIPKAISNAGLEASQIDYFEINEAFSVVALANQKLLSLNPDKVNAHGGAVSLGHPLGCSGARILVTLLGVLRHNNGKYGVGGICNGGGGASALVLELMPVTRVAHSRL